MYKKNDKIDWVFDKSIFLLSYVILLSLLSFIMIFVEIPLKKMTLFEYCLHALKPIGSLILIFFVPYIISFFVGYLIPTVTSLIKQNKLVLYNEVENEITYNAAKQIITSNLDGYDIYTQKGYIRSKVSNQIDNEKMIINDYLEINKRRYLNELYRLGLLDDNDYIQKKNIELAAEYLVKQIEEQKEFVESIADEDFIRADAFFATNSINREDFVGVYVIYNKSKNMFYVGQATRVLFRLQQHFSGKGNGDVYADYKYGDEFFVKTIRLIDSGIANLDYLERINIEKYNAFELRYNKTRGNS